MNIAVCDDDLRFAKELKNVIQKILVKKDFDRSEINIDVFSSGEEFLKSNKEIDLAFLDIEMGNLSGFDVAEKLMELNSPPDYVFVTAHDKLVFNCFKFKPLYFIRKFDVLKSKPAELKHALDLAIQKYKSRKEHINFTVNERIVNVKVKDIKYIENDRHYIVFNCVENEFTERKSMKETQEKFKGHKFIRIHSGFLVNMHWIDKLMNDHVILKDESLLPVSRHRMNDVKDAYFNYIASANN